MKGTLLSFDFVKDANGDLKFLEMNTDTTISATAVVDNISWESLINVMSGSGHTSIEAIYKPEIHQNLINSFSASVVTNAPFITSFVHHKEDLHTNFPTAVTDAEDKFVFRLAYDDNAVVDSYYCKEADKGLRLLTEFNSGSLGVSYWSSGSEGEFGNLINTSNPENYPDIVVKKKMGIIDSLKFIKVLDNTGWDNIKSTYGGDYVLTNYDISSNIQDDGVVHSYRHYVVAYGGGLEAAHLGTYINYAQFPVPITLETSGSSFYELPVKHYFEYSTSQPKAKSRLHGIFSTDRYLSASNEPIPFESIKTGTEFKSYHIPSLPDTDDVAIYSAWSHPGKTLPVGSAVTSSISTARATWYPNKEGVVFELKVSGATDPVYLGMNAAIITYNTGSDDYGFRAINTINEDKDFLFNEEGALVPIEYSNFVLLQDNTGSFWSVNVEPSDIVIVDTDATPDIISVAIHNKVKIEPPK
jgi:hypothetical protein